MSIVKDNNKKKYLGVSLTRILHLIERYKIGYEEMERCILCSWIGKTVL